ncbi:PadR family transcriptional regulator [Streptomyces sp. DT2A-34]|uniref:PadR family transcriptional regulator n=1 Tax=Streptomyces sp. DT2A-34 TaxID=3051182 RepID=UPI00265BDC26|nr:PadR family transcriptional regulator [Streptomyces sp. DT2A-34]MDO0917307.1 PadR family transcriptional regulator [Streptomyces sp. DT2A-34]
MLELAILGFLADGPLHGHELRRRVTQLSGYTRPVSDGSLYPAISRLTKAGLLERRVEPSAGAARYVLFLTEAGRVEMLKRLREPAEHEITDFTRFFTILAFLSQLPDVIDQHAVLRRRLEFLEAPASFFYDCDRPLRAEEVADPYRRGMLLTARAISRAERAWLREILGEDDPGPGAAHPSEGPGTLDERVS